VGFASWHVCTFTQWRLHSWLDQQVAVSASFSDKKLILFLHVSTAHNTQYLLHVFCVVIVSVYFLKLSSLQFLKRLLCALYVNLCWLFDLWQKWVGLFSDVKIKELVEREQPSAYWTWRTGTVMGVSELQYISEWFKCLREYRHCSVDVDI